MDPNVAIPLGIDPALFALVQHITHAGRTKSLPGGRHRQPYDGQTGPEAALRRSNRYRVSLGRASTLKKAMRVERIRNGERPLRYGPVDQEA